MTTSFPAATALATVMTRVVAEVPPDWFLPTSPRYVTAMAYCKLRVGVKFSVVLAAFIALPVVPFRFQAQIATPVLSVVVTTTTLFTAAGQSVADPVAQDIWANEITVGLAEVGVGRAWDWREYPVPVISPTPPASVAV